MLFSIGNYTRTRWVQLVGLEPMTSPSTLLLQGEGVGAIKIELVGKIWPLLKIENLASNFEGQHLPIVKITNTLRPQIT